MRSRRLGILLILLCLPVLSQAGLVEHWTFNEAASPSIGRVAGLSGTWGSGTTATTTNCRLLGCLAFDNTTNASVSLGTQAALNLSTALSIALWTNSPNVTQNGLVEKTIGGAINTQYSLFLDGGNIQFRLVKATAPTTLTGPVITANTRAHIVATYDGSTMRTYLNTVINGSTASVAAPIDSGVGAAFIGTLAGGTYPHDGPIDEVRIYDHALSLGEITALYVRGRPRSR